VAHGYNPTYLGLGDQEDHGSRPDRQKAVRPYLNKISQAWWYMPVIQGGGSWSEADPEQKQETLSEK
jgi:hypothetical protein